MDKRDAGVLADNGKGLFITFEGGEGAGKSTQISLLEKALRAGGLEVLVTREPGGSPGAEAVRIVLLSGAAEPLGPEAEAMLFSAARSDHVETVIRPALALGMTVLCDRFYDSTRVYQGATGNVDMQLLKALEDVACEDCRPDLTILLDIDPEEGLRRALLRRNPDDAPDRFEKETIDLHQRRRAAYLAIAEEEPERMVVVDASGDPAAVHDRVLSAVRERLPEALPQSQHSRKRNRSRKSGG